MLMHKREQTSNGKALKGRPAALIPSFGRAGQFRELRGELYIHGRHGGVRRVPEPLGSHMLQMLKHRNATVEKVRYALAIVAGLVLGTLIYWVR